MKTNIFLLLILSCAMLRAQSLYFAETGQGTAVVRDILKGDLHNAWAGGLNSCQFGETDMNFDGWKDLFVFDRTGNRVLCFINNGIPGQVSYTCSPEYTTRFPELYDWAILIDYDADGKEDIFTYSPGFAGIKVYRNTSATELHFDLVVYPYLKSLQGGGYVNIFVTYADYPALSDVDYDGDLDILTFWGLGSFVNYHQNQSMEKYGIPDSLDYTRVDYCWGRFAESDESNVLYLDTCVTDLSPRPAKNPHTGSTLLLTDLDGDQDKDLLLGDVDYPYLARLDNGGTPGDALITGYEMDFPSYNTPVDLFSMPVMNLVDVNNDGARDLLVSTFDPNPFVSENSDNLWLYLNTGSEQAPVFELAQKDFLTEEMIDVGAGAYPVLVDFDQDGLVDLFVSNYGRYDSSYYSAGMVLHSVYTSRVSYFRNTGTASEPAFTRMTDDFAGLSGYHLLGLYPCFADLDGDGDPDMITGSSDGTLWYFENLSPGGLFAPPVMDYSSVDVGDFSTPQLFDLDADGRKDLVIGEKEGNLNYYRNTGTTANPGFTFVTDSLGRVNVTDPSISYYGYSVPCFFHDLSGETDLLVGSEQGKVFYFPTIGGNLLEAFEESDSLFLLLGSLPVAVGSGYRTAPAMAELDNDGFLEMIVGNFSGGLKYYQAVDAPSVNRIRMTACEQRLTVSITPVPAADNITLAFTSPTPVRGVEYVMYSMYGNPLASGFTKGTKAACISIRDFPEGVYICRAVAMNGAGSKVTGGQARFIVHH
jgi:hypothetical protein